MVRERDDWGYYVRAIRDLTHPPSWRWRIIRRGNPMGVLLEAGGFSTYEAARFAGGVALADSLSSLNARNSEGLGVTPRTLGVSSSSTADTRVPHGAPTRPTAVTALCGHWGTHEALRTRASFVGQGSTHGRSSSTRPQAPYASV